VKLSPTVIRGEIWLANLDPAIGSEIQKTRPCLIVSPPEVLRVLRTVTIAPLTTKSRATSFRPALHFGGKDSLILLDQLRTLDRQRFIKKLGALSPDELRKVLSALRAFFAD
jgi:mRNA interferase MazF